MCITKMSSMKMLNKRGPRIDPCGTPSSTLHYSMILFFILFEIVPTNSFE